MPEDTSSWGWESLEAAPGVSELNSTPLCSSVMRSRRSEGREGRDGGERERERETERGRRRERGGEKGRECTSLFTDIFIKKEGGMSKSSERTQATAGQFREKVQDAPAERSRPFNDFPRDLLPSQSFQNVSTWRALPLLPPPLL